MGFGLGDIVGAVASPVMGATKALTGVSILDQAKMGAGIGAAGGLVHASGVGGGGFSPWSLLGPVIGAGADIWSANKLAEGQQEANAMSVASAREQMEFQKYMSSTAHQREVEDLKKAGLNPVLSANAGASTPSGAMGTFGNPAPDYRNIVGKGMQTAMQIKQLQKDLSVADSQIALNGAAKFREEKNAEAASASAAETREAARLRAAQADQEERENNFWRDNPKSYQLKKSMEMVSPIANTAKDMALTFGAGKYISGISRSVDGAKRGINWLSGGR